MQPHLLPVGAGQTRRFVPYSSRDPNAADIVQQARPAERLDLWLVEAELAPSELRQLRHARRVADQKSRFEVCHIRESARDRLKCRITREPGLTRFNRDHRLPRVVWTGRVEVFVGRPEKYLRERRIDNSPAPPSHRVHGRRRASQRVKHDRGEAQRGQPAGQRDGLALHPLWCAMPVPPFKGVQQRHLERGREAETRDESRANLAVRRGTLARERRRVCQHSGELHGSGYAGSATQGPQETECLAWNGGIHQVTRATDVDVVADEARRVGRGGGGAADKSQQRSVVRIDKIRLVQAKAVSQMHREQARPHRLLWWMAAGKVRDQRDRKENFGRSYARGRGAARHGGSGASLSPAEVACLVISGKI